MAMRVELRFENDDDAHAFVNVVVNNSEELNNAEFIRSFKASADLIREAEANVTKEENPGHNID